MIKCLLRALIIALMPSMAFAAASGPSQILGPHQVLRGKFTETHQMKAPSAPLRMSGRFVVAPEFGVIFKIEKPIPMTTAITPLGMAQSVPGMPLVRRLSAQEASIYARLPAMAFAALAGNWKALEPNFTVTHDGTPSAWQVYLVPKGIDMRAAPFKAISASGNQFVDQAEVLRLDGFYDLFTFYDQSIGSSALTNDEITEFKKTASPR